MKKVLILVPVVVAVIFLVLAIRGCTSLYHGPVSDHFDGTRFFTEEHDHTFTDMLKWLWEMETVEWPEWITDPSQAIPVDYVDNGRVKITYINHATTLIQLDSLNILTDPIWSERASPVSWFGTKRIRNPGIKLDDLPHINIILISHDHYDHLDIPTLQILVKRDQCQVLTGLGVKTILESHGITSVRERDWWQDYQLNTCDITITFVPAQHGSGRSFFGENRTLWGGFVIEGISGRIYFAGDTGYGQFLNDLKNQYSEFDLTIFPIGSYEKRWFMKNQHMNPDDAVKAHILLNSKQTMGIHYGTFLEHPEQTVNQHETDLKAALVSFNVSESDFWILQFGEGRYVQNKHSITQ